MSGFTSKISYAKQHDVYFDDGREIELLQRIFNLPSQKLNALRNQPAAILAVIDGFATEKYLMNIGEMKGKLVTDLISHHRPKTMVELGGYVGYSTLLFASHLRKTWIDSGVSYEPQYYCLEMNPLFGAIIMALVDLAGLSDTVKVVIGPSSSSLKRLHSEGAIDNIGLLFLDHFKPAYISDLKLCESLEFVVPGTVLAADNVIKPGNPPYLRYVRMSAEKKTIEEKKALESMVKEGIKLVNGGVEPRGNPSLIYESRTVESYEPTGIKDAIEISVCLGSIE
ncbi:uncharacterized protein LAJ45_07821 [Morchella importuna]|uniref:catechol O-methyltransferase n=1 Tax=Morchella conica CCBAS932 TaxID=1392247 RepID=A0A3N4KLR1_9PEZI|nr:uncharacterized protein LAJ45_07821 [Morchella importuna]KAH8148057.1 hypothetical protein LAJ45_07821 [Morchella importuna]RPB11503.1 S-adenosyl-L-methionine-dependent methyltransferase [Morchella conica CCBAS932]